MSHWVVGHRGLVLAMFAVITDFFFAGFPGVEIRTIFKDLLP